ncbi:DNA polymerase beta superfamily protein [Escherichia coli]|uniref:DNA polymerase beta superfamily protein n=1 Tax=Escherichia coli TaxID=562 RepID=UPI000CFCCC26|nr:nucleotidyltransferase domain-containing protein [Escherichia coli]UDW09903.1 hypothetical protein [Escherichia phage 18-1-2]UJQ87362.1 hypothetical protein [Escherichia phage 24-2-1]UJQ87567.1 hypothetical protein [Escherichia phage 19-1-2]UOX40162.1 hypothetical protein [Escherichia phage vB_EcoM_TH18]
MKKLELMRCYSGSIAYGTNLPTSDVDIRGIYCAEPKSILTPFFVDREMTLIDEEDGKLYELTNYMKLFVDMNPNIIELMFVDRGDILQTSDVYEYLREQAPKLLSSKVAFTFSGYAMAQLKRIKGHNKWINNPQPKEQPTQKEFMRLTHSWMDDNLTKHKDFQKMLDDLNKLCVFLPMGDNIYGVIGTHDNAGLFNSDGSIRKVPYEQFSDEDKRRKPILIVKYLAEEHKQAKEKHKNYWAWVKNRNLVRHDLEEKYGYDCKHALHLVRLMRMAEEILAEGKVLVKRPDAQELLAIRNGAWSLEKLLAWAEEKDDYIRNTLYKSTHLPKSTDLDFAADVLMTAQQMCWDKMND